MESVPMPRQFDCSRAIDLPASADQVWAAVATPAGNASWLFPCEIEPAKAAAWDPPRHFAIRQEQGDWFNSLDFEIEPRDGGTALHYSHRGVFFDDSDTQDEGIQQHTDFYLHTLGEYLRHFSPRIGTYIGDVPGGIQAPAASTTPDGFRRLQQALGLREQVAQGDSVRLAAPGLAPEEGVVDYARPNFLGIRTANGLYRFFGRNAFGAPVAMQMHLFNSDLDAQKTRNAWQAWLEGVYA
jgi:hypothetical protein